RIVLPEILIDIPELEFEKVLKTIETVYKFFTYDLNSQKCADPCDDDELDHLGIFYSVLYNLFEKYHDIEDGDTFKYLLFCAQLLNKIIQDARKKVILGEAIIQEKYLIKQLRCYSELQDKYDDVRDAIKDGKELKKSWQGLLFRAACQPCLGEDVIDDRPVIIKELLSFVFGEFKKLATGKKNQENINLKVIDLCLNSIKDLISPSLEDKTQKIPRNMSILVSDLYNFIRDLEACCNSSGSLDSFFTKICDNKVYFNKRADSVKAIILGFFENRSLIISELKLFWHQVQNRLKDEEKDQRKLRLNEERKLYENCTDYYIEKVFRVLAYVQTSEFYENERTRELAYAMRMLSHYYEKVLKIARETKTQENDQMFSNINLIINVMEKVDYGVPYENFWPAFDKLREVSRNSMVIGSLRNIVTDLYLDLSRTGIKIKKLEVDKGIALLNGMIYKLHNLDSKDEILIFTGVEILSKIMNKLKGIDVSNKKEFLSLFNTFLWRLMYSSLRTCTFFIDRHDQLERLRVELTLELNPVFQRKILSRKENPKKTEIIESVYYMLTRFMDIKQRAQSHPTLFQYLHIIDRKKSLTVDDLKEIIALLGRDQYTIKPYDKTEIIDLIQKCLSFFNDENISDAEQVCNESLEKFHFISQPFKELLFGISKTISTTKLWLSLFKEHEIFDFKKNLEPEDRSLVQTSHKILDSVFTTLKTFEQFGLVSFLFNNGLAQRGKIEIFKDGRKTLDTLENLLFLFKIYYPVYMRAYGFGVLNNERNGELNNKKIIIKSKNGRKKTEGTP
ncbi:hypothetical protein ACFLZV_07445, partial [Candidatus Margulisiibacteriota bacterium]